MKTTEEIEIALYESDKRGYNIWSHPKRKATDPIMGDECEYCLRKCGKNPLYVHITIDGTIIPNEITEKDLKLVKEESQGCFPIGITCAKNLFGGDLEKYTFKYK